MKRVKLIIAYDGTNYCGWQIQPNGITIEEILNKKLTSLLKEPIAVIGASRTDSGVHAEGNVAVFDTENRMPADKICFALNQRLPDDIRILHSEEVMPDWHPRKQNCVKTYEYRILNRKIELPTKRLYSHFCYVPLDVEKMQEAAAYFLGEHDFKSFCTIHAQVEETVRNIYSLNVKKTDDLIRIRVSGSGFLYNMVRIIAGTLLKVGMGVYPPSHVEEIIDGKDRTLAGPKMPARGLTLISLDYEQERKPEITGSNKYWSYCLIQSEVETTGSAYLLLERCTEDMYDRLLTRVVHQAVRNGADLVYVCDCEQSGRIVLGKSYGYYIFYDSSEQPADSFYEKNKIQMPNQKFRWYVTKKSEKI
ncbi:MAG: tRNA pseudouridine(38-40) synthase TruA [Hungatella sp.]